MALLNDEHELEGGLAVLIRYAVGRGEEIACTLPDVRAVHLALRLRVHQRFQLSPQRIGAEDELLAALSQDARALPQNRAPLGLRPRHILVRAHLRVDWCSSALGVRRVDANQVDAGVGQRFDQLEARAMGEREIVAACDRACCRAARPRVHSKRAAGGAWDQARGWGADAAAHVGFLPRRLDLSYDYGVHMCDPPEWSSPTTP